MRTQRSSRSQRGERLVYTPMPSQQDVRNDPHDADIRPGNLGVRGGFVEHPSEERSMHAMSKHRWLSFLQSSALVALLGAITTPLGAQEPIPGPAPKLPLVE